MPDKPFLGNTFRLYFLLEERNSVSFGGVIELLIKYNYYEIKYLKIEEWLLSVLNNK